MALLEAGTPAPEIQGENLTGEPVKLADYEGKRPVVLVFPPMVTDPARVNAYKAFYQNVRDKVEVIAIYERFPSKQMAKMFLRQMGVQFPVLLDEAGASFTAYGVEKPPATFYINTEGEIVASEAGGELEQVEANIQKYLF